MATSERLVLKQSQIFGGISNEILVILDESTLVNDERYAVSAEDSAFLC